MEEIAQEDTSQSHARQHHNQHHKDWAAAVDPTIYGPVEKDIFVGVYVALAWT